MHTHYLFITLWISIWFLSIIKLCRSISNKPCPIASSICHCPARAVLTTVLQKRMLIFGHPLGPGLPLWLLPQLDFPCQALNTSSPPDFQIHAEPGISRRIRTCKFVNSTFFPAISKGRSPQPRPETVGDSFCFIQKTTTLGNWSNTDMGGLTVELVALPK